MLQLSSRVLYLSRTDWGADPAYPRLGGPDDPRNPGGWVFIPHENRLYNIKHHTVGIDNDTSKNVWETLAEIKFMMRRLQLIRPDLGADVPYNFVKFLMEDGSVTVCEGRGYDRAGAHTAGVDAAGRYFNIAGIATSYAGNFEDYAISLAPWMPAINDWNGHLKQQFLKLGTLSVCRQSTCGHKDFAPFHPLNRTACPGFYLYSQLPLIHLDAAQPGDEDMVVGQFAKSVPDWDKSYVVTVGKEGARKTWVSSPAEHESLVAAGYPVRLMDVEQLRKIISSPGTPEP